MNIGAALRSGFRVLVQRPASVLPVYLLVVGLTATTRVPVLVGLAAVLGILVADGRFDALVDALEGVDFDSLDEPGADPGPEAFPPELEAALVDLLSIEVVALVGGAIVLSFVVGIIANGLSNAAAINGIYGCLYGGDGVTNAVVGIGRDWRSFVGLGLLELLIFVVGLLPLAVGAALFQVSAIAGTAATLAGVLLSAGIIVVGLLLVAFAEQSIVVDDVGVSKAVRRSVGFPFARPIAFVAYVLVTLGVFGSLGVLGGVFGALGVSQLSGLLSSLVAIPFLDAFKTALYADRPYRSLVVPDDGTQTTDSEADDAEAVADGGDRSAPTDERAPSADTHPTGASDQSSPAAERATPTEGRPAVHRRLVTAFKNGMGALGRFTLGHPGPILAAGVLFSLAAAGGWQLTAAYALDLPPTENIGEIFGTVPIGAFVMIAANNWLVSASAVYSGVAFGIPTAVDMLLNGFIVGALAGVVDPTAFVALVAPHGVIELPAIVIAGGLGFHLAVVVTGVLRGSRTSTELAGALRLAYRVLLGLAVVLVVAAFVEAFLTPMIADAVLP